MIMRIRNFEDNLLAPKSVSRTVFVLLNTGLLSLFTVISILPIVHILAMSLSDNTAVSAGRVGLWPVGFTFFSYEHIFRNQAFLNSAGVSVLRVLLGVPICMLCNICIAYPLSRPENQFPARKIYVWVFLFTMLFSAGLVPTYMIVRTTGIYDTIWALLLPGAVSAFNMLILMNFIRNLPAELTEAAMIDGASHTQILLMVVLPLSKAVLATLVLFTFVQHWNSYFDGIIYINKRELKPMQTYLQTILVRPDLARLDSEERINLFRINLRSLKAAQIFVTVTPILLVYPFLQQYFTKGIVLGSIKG